MVKQRFTALDVKAAVDEIRADVVGLRLINLYDLSPRVYLMKFGIGEKKVFVLFESGVRLHTTTYIREKPKVPSQFTLKLRKHVRSWRLDAVRQVGNDRVVDFHFGASCDASFHFVIELFGQGNFFLTDANYSIMMLLHTMSKSGNNDVVLKVRERYPIDTAARHTVDPRTSESLTVALEAAAPTDTLRACLPLSYYGLLADHMVASCGLNPNQKKATWANDIPRIAEIVLQACTAVDEALQRPLVGGCVVYVAARDRKAAAAAAEISEPDEFWPAAFAPFLDKNRVRRIDTTATFSEAVDRVFCAAEQEKIKEHNAKKESVSLSKKEKFLRDHQRRIDGLNAEQARNRMLGDLIETHVDDVDTAIELVKAALATGQSWDSLWALIRIRQAEGHPIANIIHELKLQRNLITLMLTEEAEEGYEDADVEPTLVDVDITMNAYSNAARYHRSKKAIARKLERTLDATDKAALAAEKKGERIATKVVEKKEIVSIRAAPLWFEKFYWFLTSCGDIVVSGRDALQTDAILKRYTSPGDVFVNCDDVHAVPAVVKSPGGGRMTAMASVREAGIMCAARTEAWRKSTPVSPWWCPIAHVALLPPVGKSNISPYEVRGAKKYMEPMQLQLAVGLLFRSNERRVDEEKEAADVGDVVDAEDISEQQSSHPTVQVAGAPSKATPQRPLEHSPHRTEPRAAVEGATKVVEPANTRNAKTRGTTASKGSKLLQPPHDSTAPSSEPLAKGQLDARKKTKLAKIRTRYAEQDDEDRRRAMMLLGNDISSVHKAYLAVHRRGTAPPAATGDDPHPGGDHAAIRDSSDIPAEEQDAPSAAVDDALEEEHTPQPRGDRAEADSKIRERVTSELAEIVPYLTGSLRNSSSVIVSDAMLVCAPYASIRHYDFKVRIAPGADRKGAASAAILKAFLEAVTSSASTCPASAVEVVKQIPEDMLVSQLPGCIRYNLSDAAGKEEPDDTQPDAATASDALKHLTPKQIAAKQREAKVRQEEERLRAECRARREARLRLKQAEHHADPSAAAAAAGGISVSGGE